MTLLGRPSWAVLTLIGACAAGLALLHLLRIRRPQVRVVTTLFWSEAVEAAPARALLHQFRHPRTYAFLLLIAALLALVLGRPTPTGGAAQQTTTVVVLDAGMSLSAPLADSQGTRWYAAQAAALAAAGRASAASPLAILVADPQPRVLVGYDEPRCLLASRLQAVTPAAEPAARASALRLAASLLHGRPQSQIVLITDRPLAVDETPTSLDIPLHTVPVGNPVANAAIVAAAFTPAEADPLQGRLTVRIAHWGPQATDVTLQIRSDTTSLLRQTATLAPGAAQDFTLADLAADGRELTLQLEPADAVAADSTARFRLPLRHPIRTAVSPDLPVALRALLTSDPAVRLVAPDAPADLEFRDGNAAARTDLPAIIIHSTSSQDVAAGTSVELNRTSALTLNLDFTGTTCAAGPALATADAATSALLQAGPSALVTWSPAAQPPHLDLSQALLDPDATATRHPAFAVLLTRALHQLAGWDDERLTLPAERTASDPGWPTIADAAQSLQQLAGSRSASDLSQPLPSAASAATPAAHGSAAPAWFEICLFLAGALLLLETLLHMRGRIV